MFPRGQHRAAGKRDQIHKSPFQIERHRSLRARQSNLNAAGAGPGGVQPLLPHRESDVLPVANQSLRLPRPRKEDLAIAPPSRNQPLIVDRQSAAIHWAGVQLPSPRAHFPSLFKSQSVARTANVQIARTLHHIAPHDGDPALPVNRDGRVAALANRSVRRFVNQHVLRPRHPAIYRP